MASPYKLRVEFKLYINSHIVYYIKKTSMINGDLKSIDKLR